jgi:phosphopentomutase
MSMKRFILIILDGFGIGYMEDAKFVRSQDVGTNTCKHILETTNLRLPNLEKLGLMNALGVETDSMKIKNNVLFGKAGLAHFGADTFMGHQEIMGTRPQMPIKSPFSQHIEKCRQALIDAGYKVESLGKDLKFLLVNDCVTVADNIEADYGQIYNVTGALDCINFVEVLNIGRVVRKQVDVSRVIALGGKRITAQDLIDAVEVKEGQYIGVNCSCSGVYNEGYQVIHLGYGVNSKFQVQTILGEKGIHVTLLGKVADIVENKYGKSISCVDTAKVMELTLREMQECDCGFIATNVQETDLAGHAEDVAKYGEKLKIADYYLGEIIGQLVDDDILLVMADHGNDPMAGHSHHTREYVPLLLRGSGLQPGNIGNRNTLADVGATIAAYFNVPAPESGTSFFHELKR